MPLAPLAHTPLLFLDDSSMPIDRGPFSVRPFVNNHFRSLCGLRPVTDAEDIKKKASDTDGADRPPHESLSSDGFLLTDEARASLKPEDRKFFTEAARQSHSNYLTQALKYASQHREAVASKAAKLEAEGKGKGRQRSRKDEGDTPTPCMSSTAAKKIPGHPLFKGAILAMYNRPDGIMIRIADLMKRTSRSPVHWWRDSVAEKPEADPYALTVKGSHGSLSDIITQASLELFGAAALTPSSRLPRPAYKPFVHAIVERTWERESRRLNRTLRTAVDTRERCKSALEAANNDPSWDNLREASRAVKKYKDLVDITGGKADESIAKLEGSLEDIWASLGYTRGENGTIRRVKATKKVASLTEEAMDRAYAAYVELHFPPQQEGVEELTENLAGAVNSEEETFVDLVGGQQGSDIGVSEFATKSLDEMLRLLGLAATRKIPFSSDELAIQWHQLVAVAVMVKRMFTKKPGELGRGSLLCDEVGLGKTVEVIAALCMLCHLIELQQRGLPLIPLLTESGHIYFAGEEKIPSLPSIILLPKSLCIQWISQFKRFTIPGSFRLVDYAKKGGDRLSYFEEDGDYDNHVVNASFPHRVVFLCTFTSVGAETGDTLLRPPTGAAGRDARFRGDPPTISTNNAPDRTIFAKSFLFFACDELHQLRNATSSQDAATMISCKSVVRVGATASPVFTGCKDAVAAGVIIRIMELIGDEGLSLGHELMESQRTRLKMWKARQPDLVVPASSLEADSEDTEYREAHQDIAKKLVKSADPQGLKAFFVQQPSIERIRRILAPYLIRRTSKSQTPDGKLILNIPDYIESIVWIALTELEKEALRDLYNQLMSEKPKGLQGEMLLSWNAFLMDYKHVLFHYLMRTEVENPLKAFWEEWTLENLREKASSKLLTTFDILEHYKNPAAEPLFFNRDGTRDFEKEKNFVPPPSPQTPDKPRKILIFIMYDRHADVTKLALGLLGYQYVEYNGKISDVERDRAVKAFETQDDIRVMLLSNVGTTGLNLTMASVLVFLSGLWSGMEIKQTIGRCCRPGQLLVAHIYHLLAPGTADEILSSYATSKTAMENQFFAQKKELANKIFCREDESDSEESDTDAPSTRPTRSAVVSRGLKGHEQTTDAIQPGPPTNKQAKSRKRKALVASKSKPAVDLIEQGASDGQRKRRKVLEQGGDEVATPPQSSPVASSGPRSTQMSSSRDASAGPSQQRPRPRPRMRQPSPKQAPAGAVLDLPPTPGPVGVVSAPSTSGVVSVPFASFVPPPPASAASLPKSSSLTVSPSVNLPLNAVSELASKLVARSADTPPALCSSLEPPSRQYTPPLSPQVASFEEPPSLLNPPSLTSEGTSDLSPPSPGVHVDPVLSSYDDPDVDVVGDTERDDLGENSAEHQSHINRHPAQPVSAAGPSSIPQDVWTPEEAGKAADSESGTQIDYFPDEEALMKAYVNDEIDHLDPNLIEPAAQHNAQAQAVARAPNPPQAAPIVTPPALTWRSSTTVRSSARVTPLPTSQQNRASSPSRTRDFVPQIMFQASRECSEEQPQGGVSTSSSTQKTTTGFGVFKEVSEADVPKVLTRNRRAVMEAVDNAYQTGAIKLPNSGQTRHAPRSHDVVRESVPLMTGPSRSTKNTYPSYHLDPRKGGLRK